MILFNITIIIEDSIDKQWLNWMNSEFIPSAMESNLIASNRLLKVLDSPNEGITYCLQFVIDNIDSYNQFKTSHLPLIMDNHAAQFSNRFVSFSTLMEFINN
jgi:hypothetical protein